MPEPLPPLDGLIELKVVFLQILNALDPHEFKLPLAAFLLVTKQFGLLLQQGGVEFAKLLLPAPQLGVGQVGQLVQVSVPLLIQLKSGPDQFFHFADGLVVLVQLLLEGREFLMKNFLMFVQQKGRL